jgi:two-component system, OmpR family, alkaline phosphatase synthesis response regulator PhoP
MTNSVQPTICVVDDDQGIRERLRFFFEDAGYLVEEAEDGVAALALLRTQTRPRVMLLDRMIPRLDGAGMLRQLAREPADTARHTVILFMTARNNPPSPEVADLARRYTFATVPKPFNLDALLETVQRVSERFSERARAG